MNAGHPPPLRCATAGWTASPCTPTRRSGPYADTCIECSTCRWSRDDRLVFFTDGMLERNAANLDVEALVAAAAGKHPREAVQHLIQAIHRATDGSLDDDATALCLDWHGGPPRDRTSHSGAND